MERLRLWRDLATTPLITELIKNTMDVHQVKNQRIIWTFYDMKFGINTYVQFKNKKGEKEVLIL